ncbi:MAG TPA: energy-coupling factor transporter transmembrane component T [Solirubrobacteraceae bacterium]|nr:energy-coupling factor transporter transmembrane component T [Solirubrobacteraceae bacterium]
MSVNPAAVNPVAKLIASALIAVCLLLTLDPVSAGVALVLELLLIPFLRIPPRRFWMRTLPLWIAAPLAAVTIALYGRTSGEVYAEFLLARISEGSLLLALATALRVLAIALPALVLFVTIDPTELADSLAQTLHLPSRFVLGALAGTRLIGLAAEDRRAVVLARRARGVGDRYLPSRIAGTAFSMLVLALRRGSALAIAMEARGFGSGIPRTWARPARFGWREVAFCAVGAIIGGAGITAALLTGSWAPLGG